ncbi:MAG: hypothetical protein KGL01_06060, partial [Betaproteobacteria bacterium]|nr:hypothetical protein [Betaproteobacteria bacterium]
MLNIVRMISFSLYLFVASIAYAEIIVAPVTSPEEITKNYVVNPGGYVIVPLPGSGSSSDAYKVTISASNAIYKD